MNHEEDEAKPKITVVDRRFWARDDEDDEEEKAKKPSYVAELENKLAESEKRLRETVAQHRAAVSEFENARARLSRETAKEVERHRRSILVDLLEVVDNLDRALEVQDQRATEGPLREGVVLVRDQFLAKLEGMGVRKLSSAGEPFDPERHEAVSAVPVKTPEQDGLIVGVIREAYLVGEETLRPAMVAVGKYEHAAAQGEESPSPNGGASAPDSPPEEENTIR